MTSIFSKIIAGEIPSYKVYEDEYVYAFLDINPIQKGHTLVVPRKEIDYLFNYDQDTYARIMERVQFVAQLLKEKLVCARVCMIVEGYNVPHAHIHLIPTNKPDDLDKNLAHSATKEELEEAHSIITS